MHASDSSAPVVLVGAGLANSLAALALLAARPELHLLVLEQGPVPCGNHTWSFHESDVPAGMEAVVTPLLSARWPRYQVRFPGQQRELALPYCSMHSDRVAEGLTAAIEAAPHAELRLGCAVERVTATSVTLADGEQIHAAFVLDGRGAAPSRWSHTGYQKFVGLEMAFDQPHGIEQPVIMDATGPQRDGYQFLYVLPFDAHTVLLEDTAFSPSPHLDVAQGEAAVQAMANARGLVGGRVLRREQGVLAMPWRGAGPERQVEGPLRVGFRGGYFHPATGYSTPVALRLAALLAEHAENLPGLFDSRRYRRFVAQERRQARFGRFLNRLLFTAVRGEGKRSIFERFYRLPESVIARFYAMRTRPMDRARMLIGKPPRGLAVGGALRGRVQP